MRFAARLFGFRMMSTLISCVTGVASVSLSEEELDPLEPRWRAFAPSIGFGFACMPGGLCGGGWDKFARGKPSGMRTDGGLSSRKFFAYPFTDARFVNVTGPEGLSLGGSPWTTGSGA